jgi:nucleoid DNA-binding protein
MTKADLTAAIVDRTGLTAKKSKEALEATLNTIKQGLQDDLIIELGRLGKLKTTKLTRGRRISRGLRNVAPSIFPYSRHAKTVKLKSKLDLSKNPLPTIVHPVPAEPAPVVFIKRSCAVAYPRWKRLSTRYYF